MTRCGSFEEAAWPPDKADAGEIATLAQNIVLIASYWMPFEFVRAPKAPQDAKTLARGAFHVIALAAPYLAPRASGSCSTNWRNATLPRGDSKPRR